MERVPKIKKLFKGNLIVLTTGENSQAPDWIQLLPKGKFEANETELLIDDQSLKEILDNFAKRQNDLVLDYEHQTLDGVEAPAAGWIVDLEAREDGLWAKVDWTKRGREYVEAKEYRYISPVVYYRDDDQRGYLLQNAALTNNPAIDGMKPVVAKQKNEGGKKEMNLLEQLIEMLGLAPDATDADVMAAIAALQGGGVAEMTEADMTTAVEEAVAEVEAALDETLNTVEEAVEELEIAVDSEDTVAVAKAKSKVKRVIARAKTAKAKPRVVAARHEKSDLGLRQAYAAMAVESAITVGKITPAQKQVAMTLAINDAKAFSQFLNSAPKVVAMNQEVAGGAVRTGKVITATQKEINKRMGVSDEDYLKFGGNQ